MNTWTRYRLKYLARKIIYITSRRIRNWLSDWKFALYMTKFNWMLDPRREKQLSLFLAKFNLSYEGYRRLAYFYRFWQRWGLYWRLGQCVLKKGVIK